MENLEKLNETTVDPEPSVEVPEVDSTISEESEATGEVPSSGAEITDIKDEVQDKLKQTENTSSITKLSLDDPVRDSVEGELSSDIPHEIPADPELYPKNIQYVEASLDTEKLSNEDVPETSSDEEVTTSNENSVESENPHYAANLVKNAEQNPNDSEEIDKAIENTSNAIEVVEQLDPEEEVKIEDLQPNTLYERNGYYYRTDEHGRPSGVYAELELKEGFRNTKEQGKVGHMGEEGDEGGHLIGTRFNGSTDAFNLVPQNVNLNRGYWKSMENGWATELSEGNDVRVEIQPTYGDSNSKHPDVFLVKYTVTDKETGESMPSQQIFFNQSHKGK